MSEREQAVKKEALEQISNIADEHNLSLSDIKMAFQKNKKNSLAPSKTVTLLFSYIGGAFIFAGIAIYVGLVWDELPSAARVIITFGSGLVAFILGLAALTDERFIRASTPLFLISAFMQPGGLVVFLNEYFEGGDETLAIMFITGTLSVQQSLAFWKTQRTSLLFFGLFFFFAFLSASMVKSDFNDETISLLIGFSVLLVSYGIAKTPHNAIAAFGYFCGSICFAMGCFEFLKDTQIDILLIGIAALMIYSSVVVQSRTFLFVSVLALLGYLGYFTNEYFKDIVGWPIALIVLGFVMIGISAYAVKLVQGIAEEKK
ncbi:MAG: DUF2157 domain-containing protein [Alphaproteobacteria bacterium]|nr:DUF2157 domain-containing protein [Alphaproteobacteria bacterium]